MRKDKALEFRRAAQLAAMGASDEQALAMPSLYSAWDGGGTSYDVGYIVGHGGGLWRCILAHTSQADWTPGAAPSLWARISDPAQEWPEWVQPQGAHDAYPKGTKASHSGKHWTSNVDANTWEPGVYGWTEAG